MSNAFRDTLAQSASGGHWYREDGHRIDVVTSTKGLPIKPTLVHARKLDLAPGVTTVIKSASKEALNTWRENQILLATKRCPQRDGETDADWMARVVAASHEYAENAAAAGSDLHEQIEKELADPTTLNPQVLAAAGALEAVAPGQRYGWQNEVPAVSPYGYATRADLWLPGKRVLVDVKTKVGDLEEQGVWADHGMQLAATAKALDHGIDLNTVTCAILFVRRDGVGAKLVVLKPEDVVRGWLCFRHLLGYWQARNKHRPTWAIDVSESFTK